MRQKPTKIIFRHESGKSPIFQPIEIASRLYLEADFWGINLQVGHPTRERDKAFRNPALCVVAIPNSQANHGLCSSRAIVVSQPKLPATNPFLCAAFLPASQSNSLECPSRSATLRQKRQKSVFTRTQLTQRFYIFALAISDEKRKKQRV
jgi:hypothetical protein